MGEDTGKRGELTLGRDAFMARVEAVLDPSYRLATVMLLDYAAAEDAVHDATMRAWGRYRRLRGDVTSFRTWFLSIVVRECRRARWWRLLTLRGRRRNLAGSAGLHDVLGGLPLASRSALFCHVALDLPMDEVARVLRTSHDKVRMRVYRAGRKMQAGLQREEEPER
jgi:DNA-directed RNA polymerase specialized sigma24 family protein